MSIEENKKLVRQYLEEAPRNPNIYDQILAPHFRVYNTQGPINPNEEIESSPLSEKAASEWQQSVWSDEWYYTIDELIAEDERVMARWTFHGTHQGEFAGLPATERQVSYAGINVFRIRDGKIIEIRDLYDRLWLWQQLGVFSEIRDAVMKIRKELDSQLIDLLNPPKDFPFD